MSRAPEFRTQEEFCLPVFVCLTVFLWVSPQYEGEGCTEAVGFRTCGADSVEDVLCASVLLWVSPHIEGEGCTKAVSFATLALS